jgi:hypothetical protein
MEINNDNVEYYYSLDLENKTSIAANFFIQFDTFEDSMKNLELMSVKFSKKSIKLLLHDFVEKIEIPFKNHIIYQCYLKYGIKSTDKLLKKYFNNVVDYYILEIENNLTITHLEHYKNNKDIINLIKSIKN